MPSVTDSEGIDRTVDSLHLVERDNERDTLRGLFADCLEGRSRVVIIGGGFATGKTALLRAFAERTGESGAVFLRANSSSVEKELSCGVLEQLLRNPELPVTSSERAARWLDENAMTSLLHTPEAGPNAADELVPVFRELWEIVRDLTEQRPVVIGIDDMHYADETSLRILLYLLRRLRSARLLAVFTECPTSRAVPAPLHSELYSEPQSCRITLGPLSEAGVGAMLAQHLDHGTAARLAPDIHQASAGLPSLVAALIEDLLAGPRAEEPELVAGETYSRAILGFLQRHEFPGPDVARAIAILQEPQPLSFISKLLGLDLASVEQAVNALAAANVLTGTGFRHAALKAAVLNRVPTNESRALHDRAAALLHAEGARATEVADHVIASNTARAPWVTPVLQEAAEQALSAGRPTSAIRYLKTAYQMCDDDRRLAVARRLADAEWQVDPGAVLRHLPEFRRAQDEGRLEPSGVVTPVAVLMWHGRAPEAMEMLRKAIDGRGPAGGGGGAPADVNSPQVWLYYLYPELLQQGSVHGDARYGEARLAELVTSTDVAATLAAELLNWKDCDLGAVEAVLERSQLGPHSFTRLSIALGGLFYNDDLGRAARYADVLVEQAAARRSPTWRALLTAQRALIHFRQGRLVAAERGARAALDMIPLKSWGIAAGLPLSCLVLTQTALGRLEQAADTLTLALPEEISRTSIWLHYLYARGRHHLAAGRYRAALYDFQECDRNEALSAIEPWRIGAAEALLRLGDPREAERLLDEQLGISQARHTRTRGMAMRVRARTVCDARERHALLEEAVECLANAGDRLELSRALADLGAACQKLGEADRAEELAHEADMLSRQCRGLVPKEASRARDADRPDPDEESSSAQLSERELRVATLAADGYTNREISKKLYITISTVEQHLTNVYRKLNVKRFDLKEALDEAETEPDESSCPR